MTNKKISAASLILFSLPTIPTVLLLAPLGAVLPAFYAQHTSVTMAAIGLVLVLARVFDAVTDPVIGYLSDRTKTRLGARKPWMIAGTILTVICVHRLFVPPADANVLYFTLWSACGYLAWTSIYIPYSAWASELTDNYHDRSRIFTYRSLIGGIGGLIFALGPIALSPFTGTTALNGQVLEIFAWIIMIITPLCVAIVVFAIPEPKKITMSETMKFADLGRSIRKNKLLWRFMAISVFGGLAIGVQVSLSFIVFDNYLKLGVYFSQIAGTGMLVGIIALPIWLKITKIYGKHRPWSIALLSQILVFPLMFMLEPGEGAFLPFLLLSAFVGFMGACIPVIAPAMLADLIEYEALKSDANVSGSYFSFLSFLGKSNMALSGGAGFFIVSLFGYDMTIATNDSTGVFGLLLAFAGLPALFGLAGGLLLWHYPLNQKRQEVVRARLEQRQQRATANQPIPTADIRT